MDSAPLRPSKLVCVIRRSNWKQPHYCHHHVLLSLIDANGISNRFPFRDVATVAFGSGTAACMCQLLQKEMYFLLRANVLLLWIAISKLLHTVVTVDRAWNFEVLRDDSSSPSKSKPRQKAKGNSPGCSSLKFLILGITIWYKVENWHEKLPPRRIELRTFSLQDWRSTTEL